MNTGFKMYYKQLTLPIPPKDLLDKCLYQIENNINPIQYVINSEDHMDFRTRLNSPWQFVEKSVNYRQTKNHSYSLPDEMKDWCYKNLPISKCNRIVLDLFHSGDFVLPHTDKFCSTSFNLVLNDNEGITCWYEPKKEFSHLQLPLQGENAQFLYERLDKVDELKCQKNVWYMLKNKCIHSVENINHSKRMLLKIVFFDYVFDEFLDY